MLDIKVKIVGFGSRYDMPPIVGTVKSVKDGVIYAEAHGEKMKFNLWSGRRMVQGDSCSRGMILAKASHKKVALAGWSQ